MATLPQFPSIKDDQGTEALRQPSTVLESKASAADERAFKESVAAAINKTANTLAAKFPPESPDVDLKFIFAGDPRGKGYWWTSYFLIDKANYAPAISD